MAAPASELTERQVIDNYLIFKKHQTEADKEYGFGVLQGREFVRISNGDNWLSKRLFDFLKLLYRVTFGLVGINTKDDAIATLKDKTFKILPDLFPAKAVSSAEKARLVFTDVLREPADQTETIEALQREIAAKRLKITALERQLEEVGPKAPCTVCTEKDKRIQALEFTNTVLERSVAPTKPPTIPAAASSSTSDHLLTLLAKNEELERTLQQREKEIKVLRDRLEKLEEIRDKELLKDLEDEGVMLDEEDPVDDADEPEEEEEEETDTAAGTSLATPSTQPDKPLPHHNPLVFTPGPAPLTPTASATSSDKQEKKD